MFLKEESHVAALKVEIIQLLIIVIKGACTCLNGLILFLEKKLKAVLCFSQAEHNTTC